MTMAMTEQSSPPTSPAAAKPFRYAMLIPTLLVSGVAPIAILKTLEAFGVTPVWALAAGCVPPTLSNLIGWFRSRRLDPIGLLVMGSMASGTVGTLVSGKLAYRIVTDVLTSTAWGSVFLTSLLFARPVMFVLIRELVAAGDAGRREIWNGLWRYPSFRSAMRTLTAIWGAFYFAGIAIELALASTLPAETVVSVGSILSTGITLALIVFTREYMKATRKRLEREEHLTWPL